ncbi:MAG: DnaB-like helicase N-terminal domain-containing protein, partial [Ginsengibacter sp.]
MDLTNLNKDRKQRRKSSLDLSTMVYGKVPPQAKDLEEAVLGAIMLEKNAFDAIVEILKPECFYVEAHQRIFTAMRSLVNKSQPIDILTVVEELRSKEELEIVGGPYYVTKLTNAVVSSANIEAHAKIILQKFIQREL